MRLKEGSICLSLCLAWAVITGCGQNRHPELRQVSGTVTHEGQAVEDATVAFINESSSRIASGRTDAEGGFYLTSYDDNDGALPGEHVVVISKTEELEDAPSLSMDEALKTRRSKRTAAKHLIPAKYASRDTSPLKVTVTENGPNQFALELTD